MEYFNYDIWKELIEAHGLSIGFYNQRERDKDEILPWDFIDIGVRRDFLWKEYMNAKAETVTPNCKQKCSGCGAAIFGGGVCYENKG